MESPREMRIKFTWANTMPVLIAVLENGTAEGKREAHEELMKLARHLTEHEHLLQAAGEMRAALGAILQESDLLPEGLFAQAAQAVAKADGQS
jgi:hypothetical protein